MKTQLQCKQKEIKTLKSSGAVLSARVDAEKQEKLRLDTYSRREKLRLIGKTESESDTNDRIGYGGSSISKRIYQYHKII